MLAKNFVLMKTFIRKSKLGLTATDIIFGLVVFGAVYGSYLYVPIVYKTQELETLVKDYTFKTSAATEEMIRAAVVEDAKNKLDIDLNVDDVVVEKISGRTKIKATWNAVIELPFGYQIVRPVTVDYDRKMMM